MHQSAPERAETRQNAAIPDRNIFRFMVYPTRYFGSQKKGLASKQSER